MTQHPVLSTTRLCLRPVAHEDVPAFHRQWNLSEVGRFLWDGKPVALETVEAAIAASQDAFEQAGYGLWSLRPGSASPEAEPLGFCGLRVPEGGSDPEILFALTPSAWGRGYAREAAEAVLHHAFATLGLRRITAGANPDNPSSWRVLERVGLRRTGQVRTEIEDLYTYEVTIPLPKGPPPQGKPMTPATALIVAALLQAPPIAQPGPAVEPTPALPADTVTLEGPAVVFVTPKGPAGDALREQLARLQETFNKKSVRALATAPTLVRLGEEANPRKRVRKVDFRNTPQWAGTVIFSESYEPRIHQGLDGDERLLKRIETYMTTAKKAEEKAKKSR